MAVRNDQLAQFAFEAPAYQRMRGEIVDSRSDRRHGTLCSIGIFVTQELQCALHMSSVDAAEGAVRQRILDCNSLDRARVIIGEPNRPVSDSERIAARPRPLTNESIGG
jgi:hypothetical protein